MIQVLPNLHSVPAALQVCLQVTLSPKRDSRALQAGINTLFLHLLLQRMVALSLPLQGVLMMGLARAYGRQLEHQLDAGKVSPARQMV